MITCAQTNGWSRVRVHKLLLCACANHHECNNSTHPWPPDVAHTFALQIGRVTNHLLHSEMEHLNLQTSDSFALLGRSRVHKRRSFDAAYIAYTLEVGVVIVRCHSDTSSTQDVAAPCLCSPTTIQAQQVYTGFWWQSTSKDCKHIHVSTCIECVVGWLKHGLSMQRFLVIFLFSATQNRELGSGDVEVVQQALLLLVDQLHKPENITSACREGITSWVLVYI